MKAYFHAAIRISGRLIVVEALLEHGMLVRTDHMSHEFMHLQRHCLVTRLSYMPETQLEINIAPCIKLS